MTEMKEDMNDAAPSGRCAAMLKLERDLWQADSPFIVSLARKGAWTAAHRPANSNMIIEAQFGQRNLAPKLIGCEVHDSSNAQMRGSFALLRQNISRQSGSRQGCSMLSG